MQSSNSTLNLSSLDFDLLRENFRTFLKAQPTFKDYNFDGSNMTVLLDVMSYNTYLNSFYLNMVSSEMFLDSAQQYDSAISHAKELNYVPQSTRSAVAEVSFTVETTGLNKSLLIPKELLFTGVNSNGTYSFTTDAQSVVTSTNNTFYVSNLQIYEGVYQTDSFIVDYNIEDQKFIMSNKSVDTNSLTVTVYDNNSNTPHTYSKASTLFGLDSTSNVYFLQSTHSNKYEVVFGDGYFGRKPFNASTVVLNYRVSNGSDSNGVKDIIFIDDFTIVNGGGASITDFSVVSPSASGANQESISSIKFSAPRYFATQYRAVSTDDYASVVRTNFAGEISDVTVYGGQDLEPKLYGRVIVCVKPNGTTVTPNFLKDRITKLLQDYIALPNRVIVSDPDYFYVSVGTTVQYDKTIAQKYINEIRSLAAKQIINYSKNNLEKFNNDLRYSRLVTSIDETDRSITSNDTDVRIIKRIAPKKNFETTYEIMFNNQPEYDGKTPVLSSSAFKYRDTKTGVVYETSYMSDDMKGNVIVYTITNNQYILLNGAAGKINYTTGRVALENFIVVDYDQYISIYLNPKNKDIIASKNMVLVIEPSDVSVNVIETIR